MATDEAQTLINTPVVFLPAATVDAVLASSDRIGALRAQADVADTSVMVGTDENPLRLRIHLFSHVHVDVERVGDIGTNHGYLSGQPVVPASDGSGPQPTPSADVTKDANAVGNSATGVYFGPADSPPSVDDAQSTTDAATGQVSDMVSYAAGDGSTYTAAITAVSWDQTDDQDTDQPYTDVFCRLTRTPPAA